MGRYTIICKLMLDNFDDNSHINTTKCSAGRRTFLLASAMFLVGCGTKKVTSTLPSPIWSGSTPVPLDPSQVDVTLPESTIMLGAISRNKWAQGQPIPKHMNRMLPARYITIHHDGMNAFTSTSKSSAASRLELIRRSHLRRDGGRWGDIGYHFAIDPAGRLWQARPLTWQGAHVRAKNEGNIGVVVLGNFEQQSVNRAQIASVTSTLQSLMNKFNVPISKVRTHQEWAATACPGKSLQQSMVGIRGRALI